MIIKRPSDKYYKSFHEFDYSSTLIIRVKNKYEVDLNNIGYMNDDLAVNNEEDLKHDSTYSKENDFIYLFYEAPLNWREIDNLDHIVLKLLGLNLEWIISFEIKN